MNFLDYIILAFVIIGFVLGYKDGLIRKIIGLVGIFLAIFCAVKFSHGLAVVISPLVSSDLYFAELTASVILFIAVIVLSSIVKRLIHPHDKINQLANQLLGGALGIIQIAFFLSGAFLFLNVFNVPKEQSAKDSSLYTYVYNIIPKTIDFIIGETPDTKKFLHEYFEGKEKSEIDSTKKDDPKQDGTAPVKKSAEKEKIKKNKRQDKSK